MRWPCPFRVTGYNSKKRSADGYKSFTCVNGIIPFNEGIDDRNVELYNKIVDVRHDIAHGKLPIVTFRDIESGFGLAEEVLSCFESALSDIDEERPAALSG